MPKPYSLDFQTTLPRKIRYNTPYFKFLKLKGKFNVQLLPPQEKTGTPAQEETRIQKTTAEAVEHAETTVSQTLETVQENIGEKAEELMAAVETAVESAKEHAEEICETLVEHVSETVEHVHAVVSENVF